MKPKKRSEADIEEEMEEIEVEEEKNKWGAFRYVIALVLMLMVATMILPRYVVKLDPSPTNIPLIEDVVPDNITLTEHIEIENKEEILTLVRANDPVVKLVADKIVTQSCGSNAICYAKALFYFVRDNFDYVSDPYSYEYIKTARESLASQGGDCDDAAVLLATMLESIGITTRFVLVPGHIYIQAYMPDAPARYRDRRGWINLDATCKSCDFGELHYSTWKKEKVFIG